MAKNFGLLFKVKWFFNKQSLLSLYYSYIHRSAWLGEAHIWQTWKELYSKQQHAMRIICYKGKFEHAKQLFQSSKILKDFKNRLILPN